MCGLTGCASTETQSNRAWLSAARDTLTHRGPDDAGEWWSDDGRVGLAHRRLAILDLSPLGHQPMHLVDRQLSIVFNGEIYNFADLRTDLEQRGHRFRSHCDTEVILAAYAEWGDDCLKHLNGMFALALYDAREQRVLLARDRAGEKPLFYRADGSTIYFGSELKALLANSELPRRINPSALDCYLLLGYIPGDLCVLAGYNKLPPAHALSFDVRRGSVKVWRYWEVPEFDAGAPVDESALVDELDSLMEAAVARQLRADVPVGVLLSGGIDSSLVTAMAVRNSSQVRTFSIGFPGHGDLDETAHARLVANHFGTDHTELMMEPATADLIPELAVQFDEPIADLSMIPTYLVSRLVREQCTVALGGDGGDELFGGYSRYSRLLWMQDRLLKGIPVGGRKSLAWMAQHVLPVGFKGRNYLQALAVDFAHDVPLISTYFDAATRRRLMRGESSWETTADQVVRAATPIEPDLVQRATRMDFHNSFPEAILVKVDRASMLTSLEVRAPLLDQHVIEFAFGRVPSALKATTDQRKILPKLLTERLLPPEFDRQRKQGFSVPIAQWLRKGPFHDLFWDVLGSADCIFDPKAIRSLERGQLRGLVNGDRLFALVEFELWRKAYGTHL
ncbi:MAG: asparagine synthase (glutamine-hydrolyzing) [Mycobacterium sp.]|nr:asparagine synthase (glutamine-hydrolyzing) [Mycobacterium sp.]